MNSNYGYDSFVLDDNYYTDSFYNDMVNSIQIKKTEFPPVKESFSDKLTSAVGCKCNQLIHKLHRCNKLLYDKTNEILEIKSQVYMFYILLIVAVFVIISQRMTINTLNQFLYIVKMQQNGAGGMSGMNGFNTQTILKSQ
jgi:hypothetical protein